MVLTADHQCLLHSMETDHTTGDTCSLSQATVRHGNKNGQNNNRMKQTTKRDTGRTEQVLGSEAAVMHVYLLPLSLQGTVLLLQLVMLTDKADILGVELHGRQLPCARGCCSSAAISQRLMVLQQSWIAILFQSLLESLNGLVPLMTGLLCCIQALLQLRRSLLLVCLEGLQCQP